VPRTIGIDAAPAGEAPLAAGKYIVARSSPPVCARTRSRPFRRSPGSALPAICN